MNPSGLLTVLMKRLYCPQKGRAEATVAEVLLEYVHVDSILIATMMSDGASATMHAIRILGTEDTPTAERCNQLRSYLVRLDCTFNSSGCMQIPGHTQHMLKR